MSCSPGEKERLLNTGKSDKEDPSLADAHLLLGNLEEETGLNLENIMFRLSKD